MNGHLKLSERAFKINADPNRNGRSFENYLKENLNKYFFMINEEAF